MHSKGYNWAVTIEFSKTAPSLKRVMLHLFQVQAELNQTNANNHRIQSLNVIFLICRKSIHSHRAWLKLERLKSLNFMSLVKAIGMIVWAVFVTVFVGPVLGSPCLSICLCRMSKPADSSAVNTQWGTNRQGTNKSTLNGKQSQLTVFCTLGTQSALNCCIIKPFTHI